MYSVTVRDHVMIAHELRGAVFGPAQRLHGATYTIEVTLRRAELDDDGIVVDIGLALDELGAVLDPLRYRNLDELPAFAGVNSTTEVVARHVFDEMRDRLAARVTVGAGGLESMLVTVIETPDARAAYDGSLLDGADG